MSVTITTGRFPNLERGLYNILTSPKHKERMQDLIGVVLDPSRKGSLVPALTKVVGLEPAAVRDLQRFEDTVLSPLKAGLEQACKAFEKDAAVYLLRRHYES